MTDDEKLHNACDAIQSFKDYIVRYIEWKRCGLTVAKKDIEDIIEQCNMTKNDVDTIADIVSEEI